MKFATYYDGSFVYPIVYILKANGFKMSAHLATTTGHSSLELQVRMCCHPAINVHTSKINPIDRVAGFIRLKEGCHVL